MLKGNGKLMNNKNGPFEFYIVDSDCVSVSGHVTISVLAAFLLDMTVLKYHIA